MIITTIKRVFKAGVIGFFRNTFVSIATMMVMMVTLLVIGATLFMNEALTTTLNEVKGKVDINAYFVTTAPEEKILELKKRLEQLPEVSEVRYISREQALSDFKERYSTDQTTLQALEELGDNPLGASLAIRAKDPSQYEAINNFFDDITAVKEGQESLIETVNYNKNKIVIERLIKLMDMTDKAAFGVAMFLIAASVMIAFNTIRLAIYTNKDEIEVMQLVGASNWYVRAPYLIEGALYGLVAGLLTLAVLYPIAWYLGPLSESFFVSFNTLTYYISHFDLFFKYIVGSGVVLGAVSSFLAVRRYLGV